MKKNNITEFDEYNNNVNMPDNPEIEDISDEMIDAYLNAAAMETPDLWDKIEVGYNKEYAQIQKETNPNIIEFNADNKAKKRKIPKHYFGLVAAVLLIVIIAIPVMNMGDRTKSDKRSSDSIAKEESFDETPSYDEAYSEAASDEISSNESVSASDESSYNESDSDENVDNGNYTYHNEQTKEPDTEKSLCVLGEVTKQDGQYILEVKDIISNEYEEFSLVSGVKIIIVNYEEITGADNTKDEIILVDITINKEGIFEAKIKY